MSEFQNSHFSQAGALTMGNPFTSRNMIKDPEAFFGRRNEIEQIFTNLNENFQNTSVVGERRSGKSSLLWHIAQPEIYQKYTQNSDKPFLFVFLDLQRVAGLNQEAFFKLLGNRLVDKLPGDHVLDRDDFETHQEYFRELIEEACEDFHIVICLDEFETLTTSTEFNKGFLQSMRSFANQGQVAYITSSRDHLEDICQHTEHIMGSDFWNIFVSPPLYLGLLQKDEAIDLINVPSAKAGLPFQQAEIDCVIHVAGYHPLFLQIACFYVFEMKKRRLEANEGDELDQVDHRHIFNDFVMGAAPHFNQIWKRLSPVERKVLADSGNIDPDGEYRHTVSALLKKGLLIRDQALKPFCESFQLFVKENFTSEREALEEPVSVEPGRAQAGVLTQRAERRGVFSLVPPQREGTPKLCRLDIWIGQSGQILLSLDGPHSISQFCPNQARFDANTIKRFDMRVRNIPNTEDWRLEKQEIGMDVEALFDTIPELSQIYTEGRATVGEDDRFLITFKCPKEMLAFPFEFINSISSVDEGHKHLALCHPMRKSIIGIRSKKKPLEPQFHLDKDVKMLLVSSNVSGAIKLNDKTYSLPEIHGAVKEAEQLEEMISELKQAGKAQISVDVKYDVTCDDIIDLLQYGDYDIVHYSGHGLFSESPEDSCLFFWKRQGGKSRQNSIETISATELNTLVEGSKLKFIYLSCCQGAMVGTVDQLLYNDFLGITHSLLVGGVPAVLAMRWPLGDEMAILLASSFYRELFAGRGIEMSLFRARRRVQSKNTNDYTWLSPILVVQSN